MEKHTQRHTYLPPTNLEHWALFCAIGCDRNRSIHNGCCSERGESKNMRALAIDINAPNGHSGNRIQKYDKNQIQWAYENDQAAGVFKIKMFNLIYLFMFFYNCRLFCMCVSIVFRMRSFTQQI